MSNLRDQETIKPNALRFRTCASVLALVAAGAILPAYAQTADETDVKIVEEVLVQGMRSSIQSAQQLKKESTQIIDSIVADDIGKLPDRSVTETLQRVPGVTIDHFAQLNDPEHFSVEGSGVQVRGLTEVRSELNGRDTFSADGGRTLSFQDVPPELMAGVDVYKNQSADMAEGGLGGTVNLRTKKPFDTDGRSFGVTIEGNYGSFVEKISPSMSVLFSDRWDVGEGELGLLLDFAHSEAATRTDGIYARPYFARDINDLGNEDLAEINALPVNERVYTPQGADWRTYGFDREREGAYGVLQWAPNSDLEMGIQIFRSSYAERWDEKSFFVSNWVYNMVPMEEDDWEFDENNRFTRGTYTSWDGIPMGSATRFAEKDSNTTDYSYFLEWSVNDRLSLNLDLQRVEATTKGIGSTVAVGVHPPTMKMDLTGNTPVITVDQDYMRDASNYYWAFTMDNRVDNKATETAAKIDLQYVFEDSFITEVKGGVRFTDSEGDNHDGSYDWQAVYQPWMRWWKIAGDQPIPKVADASQLQVNAFSDFYRGDATHPGVTLSPINSLAENFPGGYQQVHNEALNSGNFLCCGNEFVPRDIYSPQWTNVQAEKTSAIYGMTFFAWDELAYPVDGNVGVRVVKTENNATGYVNYPDLITRTDGTQDFYNESEIVEAKNSYTNVLPSLNLRISLTDELFVRFAASKAIARPAFNSMQAYRTLNADLPEGRTVMQPEDPTEAENWEPVTLDDFILSASSDDNPYLEPVKANQYDLSAEWYFDEAGGMLHVNAFRKDLSNLIRKSTAYEQWGGDTYMVEAPVNTGKADLRGVEIGIKKFFDTLPAPFDGLGIDASYTFIDSETHIGPSVEPIDTDGTLYGKLPYFGISKNAYNIVGMYEKAGWSARLAYNWRSKFLMSTDANGFRDSDGKWRLPVYNNDYGQLDASLDYDVSDNVSVGVQAINLLNAKTELIIDQNGAGDHRSSYVYDTTIIARVSVSF